MSNTDNAEMPEIPQYLSHSSYTGQITASYNFEGAEGLTKREYREYFAAIAMQGLLSNSEFVDKCLHGGQSLDETIPEMSVSMANALLKELEK